MTLLDRVNYCNYFPSAGKALDSLCIGFWVRLLGEKKYTDGIISGWMSATKQETEKQKLPQYLKLISIYLLCVCVCVCAVQNYASLQ